MMWAGVVGQGALTVHYCRLRILAWTDMRCDIGFRSHHWFFKHKSTFVTDIEGSKVCACPCFVLSRYVFVVHVHTLVSHTWVALSQIVCRHVYTSSLWAQLHSIWFLMHPHLLRCHDAKDTNSIWVAVWANARCREFQGAVIPSIASCLCVFLWVKWTRVKVKNRHVKPKLTVVFFLAFWLATRTRHLLVWSNILFVSLIFSFSWRVSALLHDQMDGYQVENPCGICPASLYSFWDRPSLVSSARVLRKCVWWCNATCDSTLLIVIGCMNIHEDMHRGENLRWGKSQTNQPLTSYKDLCADGTFRRCDQNRVRMFGGRRVSSQTVGESK